MVGRASNNTSAKAADQPQNMRDHSHITQSMYEWWMYYLSISLLLTYWKSQHINKWGKPASVSKVVLFATAPRNEVQWRCVDFIICLLWNRLSERNGFVLIRSPHSVGLYTNVSSRNLCGRATKFEIMFKLMLINDYNLLMIFIAIVGLFKCGYIEFWTEINIVYIEPKPFVR